MPNHFYRAFPQHRPIGIGIVAPSGAAPDDANLQAGEAALRALGLQVRTFYHHEQRFQRFGASDAARLQQLNDALDDPDLDVIMGLRGSYGLSRLLGSLDYQKIADSGKLLVGYSDFNALQLAMLAKTQTASLCGPMLCNDFTRADLRAYTLAQFKMVLFERRMQVQFQTDLEGKRQLQGPLWGGNLAMICHLLGTEFFPQIEGGILFVEDVAEHPFRIERMLLQLHYAGVLKRQQAIVLGDFSAYRLAPQDRGYDFSTMLSYLRSCLPIPILTGLPFGHCDDKASLMQGAWTHLDWQGHDVQLTAQF